MMTEYKRQIDKLCNDSITLTAEDILSAARKTAPVQEKPKKRMRFMPLVAAAACFLVVGVTAVAVTGGWGELISRLFGDNTTAQIADDGYVTELSQQGSDGAFTVGLIAVTGDENAPKLVFDVTTDDSVTSDKIFMSAYVLSKEKYDNELQNYAPCTAYGYRDAEQANLYHVLMDAPSAYFANPTDIVVDVCGIMAAPDTDSEVNHKTKIRFSFLSEDVKLLPVVDCYPDDVEFEYNGITYELLKFTSGAYESELNFRFDYIGTEFADGETDFAALESRLMDNWKSFAEQIVLTVDGKEYRISKPDMYLIYHDADGETSKKNSCYIAGVLPCTGMEPAAQATLTVGDITCELNGG